MKKTQNIIIGIALVILGVLFGLSRLDLFTFNIFFDGWWTLFIIIPSLVCLFTSREKTGSVIFLLFGVGLLLANLKIIRFNIFWNLLLPGIIVIIGLSMIFGSFCTRRVQKIESDLFENGKSLKNGFAAFSGSKLNFNGEVFDGAELTAIFGGVQCYALNSIINEDVVIKATAIFGGIDIVLPPDVNYEIISTSIFGGVNDKGRNCYKKVDGAPTVYIKATCMFGGVDIK